MTHISSYDQLVDALNKPLLGLCLHDLYVPRSASLRRPSCGGVISISYFSHLI